MAREHVHLIGVGGTGDLAHLAVILGPLILVVDQEHDRRSQGAAEFSPGVDGDLISFLAWGGKVALPRSAAGQLRLDIRLGQFHPGGTTIDDGADLVRLRFDEHHHRITLRPAKADSVAAIGWGGPAPATAAKNAYKDGAPVSPAVSAQTAINPNGSKWIETASRSFDRLFRKADGSSSAA